MELLPLLNGVCELPFDINYCKNTIKDYKGSKTMRPFVRLAKKYFATQLKANIQYSY